MLEFMYAIPREQIVRVGRRRSLMKRALIGIVPDELLNRRRTAVAPQESDRPISIEWPSTSEIGEHLVGSYTGLMDAIRFLETLQRARRNEEVAIDMLVRTIKLEFWLRHVTNRGIVAASMSRKRSQSSFSLDAKKLPSARPFNSSAS
jgi:asparagine synthase (glutamine-hydrolysing)